MSNLQVLTAALRIAGLYLLVTAVSNSSGFLSLFLTTPDLLPVGWVWLYLVPLALQLLLVLAMVLMPLKLANWAAPNVSDSTCHGDFPDVALIGVRLLGLYFILQSVPGLLSIPYIWPNVSTGQTDFLRFALSNIVPSLIFLISGVWMFFGGQRLSRFIKNARSANFERREPD